MGLFNRKRNAAEPTDVVDPANPPKEKVKWSKRPASE